jgi:putative endonuclease
MKSGLLIFMEYYLYILKSSKIGKYYIGISQNPQKRLDYHNTFEKGFTSRYRPWSIVYTQLFNSKFEASMAEKKLKNWKSKNMIERVIKREITV